MMTWTLPDILAPGLSVVFCGLNPGNAAAAAGHHFVGKGNRFWRVIHLSGFTPRQIDPEQDASLLAFGCGLTAVVERPTATGREVGVDEFVASGLALRGKIERYAPHHLAFLGKAAFAAITAERNVEWGRQQFRIGETEVSGAGRGGSVSGFAANDAAGVHQRTGGSSDAPYSWCGCGDGIAGPGTFCSSGSCDRRANGQEPDARLRAYRRRRIGGKKPPVPAAQRIRRYPTGLMLSFNPSLTAREQTGPDAMGLLSCCFTAKLIGYL